MDWYALISRLEKMKKKRQIEGVRRGDKDQEAMSMALYAMRENPKEAGVTKKTMSVFSYLTNNPLAILVFDKNVTEAFDVAKRALEVAADNDLKQKHSSIKGGNAW